MFLGSAIVCYCINGTRLIDLIKSYGREEPNVYCYLYSLPSKEIYPNESLALPIFISFACSINSFDYRYQPLPRPAELMVILCVSSTSIVLGSEGREGQGAGRHI